MYPISASVLYFHAQWQKIKNRLESFLAMLNWTYIEAFLRIQIAFVFN